MKELLLLVVFSEECYFIYIKENRVQENRLKGTTWNIYKCSSTIILKHLAELSTLFTTCTKIGRK